MISTTSYNRHRFRSLRKSVWPQWDCVILSRKKCEVYGYAPRGSRFLAELKRKPLAWHSMMSAAALSLISAAKPSIIGGNLVQGGCTSYWEMRASSAWWEGQNIDYQGRA